MSFVTLPFHYWYTSYWSPLAGLGHRWLRSHIIDWSLACWYFHHQYYYHLRHYQSLPYLFSSICFFAIVISHYCYALNGFLCQCSQEQIRSITYGSFSLLPYTDCWRLSSSHTAIITDTCRQYHWWQYTITMPPPRCLPCCHYVIIIIGVIATSHFPSLLYVRRPCSPYYTLVASYTLRLSAFNWGQHQYQCHFPSSRLSLGIMPFLGLCLFTTLIGQYQ